MDQSYLLFPVSIFVHRLLPAYQGTEDRRVGILLFPGRSGSDILKGPDLPISRSASVPPCPRFDEGKCASSRSRSESC